MNVSLLFFRSMHVSQTQVTAHHAHKISSHVTRPYVMLVVVCLTVNETQAPAHGVKISATLNALKEFSVVINVAMT